MFCKTHMSHKIEEVSKVHIEIGTLRRSVYKAFAAL